MADNQSREENIAKPGHQLIMNWQLIEENLRGEPKFRIKQARQLIFRDFISDWEEATTFSLALRQKLQKECPLEIKAVRVDSLDQNASKALVVYPDGAKVEAVLMRHDDGRNTVCVSTQVGCPVGCSFCATGKLGLKRNLTSDEIIDQVLFFARLLKKDQEKIGGIVYMGMGEPFLNYDNVLQSIRTLNDKDGFNLGIRHFSVSTVGVVPGILKLADENLDINLAISLHAPNDKLRLKMIPMNARYSIKEVLAAVDKYLEKTRRRVMFEYVMIKDLNDSDDCAKELRKILRGKLCFVNLITYNETNVYAPATKERIDQFKMLLEERGIETTHRFRFGHDIAAACGQLAGGAR